MHRWRPIGGNQSRKNGVGPVWLTQCQVQVHQCGYRHLSCLIHPSATHIRKPEINMNGNCTDEQKKTDCDFVESISTSRSRGRAFYDFFCGACNENYIPKTGYEDFMLLICSIATEIGNCTVELLFKVWSFLVSEHYSNYNLAKIWYFSRQTFYHSSYCEQSFPELRIQCRRFWWQLLCRMVFQTIRGHRVYSSDEMTSEELSAHHYLPVVIE